MPLLWLIASGYDVSIRGASLFTALKEQLGLELRRETAPVPLLVIDHIEDPADN